jgi:hypothetical protein
MAEAAEEEGWTPQQIAWATAKLAEMNAQGINVQPVGDELVAVGPDFMVAQEVVR